MSAVQETDVGRAVVMLMESRGLDVYQEVELSRYGGVRADIVVLGEGYVWVISCKRHAGDALWASCRSWRNWASRVSGAWYSSSGRLRGATKQRADAEQLQNGFGAIVVGPYGASEAIEPHPLHVVEAIEERLRSKCTPHHKGQFAEAGAPGGERVTEFKITAAQIVAYVQGNPGCNLEECVAAITHHYYNDATAVGRLRDLIARRNAVRGVLGRRFGKTVLLYPKPGG